MLPSFHQTMNWSKGSNSDNWKASLRRQAQLAVLAFKAKVAVSADLYLDGFDTHANHDPGAQLAIGELDGFRRLSVGVGGDP